MSTGLFIALLAGSLLLIWVVIRLLAPRMMIITRPSKFGFDETVDKLSENIGEMDGWVLQSVWDVNESMAKNGVEFPRRVKKINLCNPHYASEVLEGERWASSMMPCGIAVWEDNNGSVWISKLNTGLMGKLFGGAIAKVMSQKAAVDEEKIIAKVIG